MQDSGGRPQPQPQVRRVGSRELQRKSTAESLMTTQSGSKILLRIAQMTLYIGFDIVAEKLCFKGRIGALAIELVVGDREGMRGLHAIMNYDL